MTTPRPTPSVPLPAELTPFDITASLPEVGTTLLEASAGTGKTWTIGALVTRYVAEGVARLEDMLVVTFGRAASQELRERVRAQLVEAERALDGDAGLDPTPSALLALLVDCDAAERARRHQRVVDALAGFDAATIATTHQFCSLVLGSLGVAGDTDARARLVEDLDDLVREVVDDLYLRAFAFAETAPAFGYAEALAIARSAVGDPQARLEPVGSDRSTLHGRKVAFAERVRSEVESRKRRLGVLSYDDLLSQLADALEADDSPARTRMRERWSIVLVDEFQDTDPVQWQVLDRAFSGVARMVLIGDPKQAIYAFRGGDVTTYLAAAETAAVRQTLAVNRRSDAGLLAGFQELLVGATLGHERIVVRPVTAHHDTTRLAGAPVGAPFRLRVVRREDLGKGPRTSLLVGDVRPLVAHDLAVDVRRLLASGATFGEEPLQPRDVAVICYRHADLAASQRALHDAGVPAVIAGGGSVFATSAAVEWLTLLEALEQPHRSARVRAAALTCFFGHTARELAEQGYGRDELGTDPLTDPLTDRVAETLRRWVGLVEQRGVAAVVEAASASGLPARVLSEVGGERRLTDLRHLGEALHEVAHTERLGVVSLLAWLREQVVAGRDGRGTERTRRLDSDAAAVQLVTIHASKGLEYPVVYLPSLADRHLPKPSRPLFHDESGERCLDVGGAGPEWDDHVRRWVDEEAGEWLRLLYVAVTRAQSQVVCWWAPTKNAVASPLHRLLMRAGADDEVPGQPPVPPDDEVVARFAAWRDRGGPAPERAWPADPGPDPDRPVVVGLGVRHFDRAVDTTWRRTSYSSLSAVEVAAPAVGSEPEDAPKDDEDVSALDEAALPALPEDEAALAAVDSPMASLPVGATFGSLVHAVLEHADPDAPDLRAELATHVAEQLVRWPVDVDREVLLDALVAVCDTPLGSAVGDATLRGIPLRDRLRELDFELPLAGGDLAPDHGPAAGARLGDLAPLLRAHLPEGDPVRGYADALDVPALGGQALRGYLTGSVDVVLRVRGPVAGGASDGGDPRYVIVDYKTNWLGPREDPLTAHAYRPAALDAAMAHSDYPLQALLYAVVLHRFLRWRQPGYDPARHLGGVLYLYLRGLCGPDAPRVDGEPCGVFVWRPPVPLLEAVSDLLDGGAR